MRKLLRILERTALLPLLLFAIPAYAQSPSADRTAGYVGGSGLITYYGQTGMFLNPTSGTRHAGDFSPQTCALTFRVGNNTAYAQGVLASYGVRDWLEVGAFAVGLRASGSGIGSGGANAPGSQTPGNTLLAGQGNVRVRVQKEHDGLPEVSFGGAYRAGHDYLQQGSTFLAASKAVGSVRVHAGFKQVWQDAKIHQANGSIAFGGIDISLAHDLHLVSEISSRDDIYAKTPYSAGIQWRRPKGVALSFAFLRTDQWSANGFLAGIGVNF